MLSRVLESVHLVAASTICDQHFRPYADCSYLDCIKVLQKNFTYSIKKMKPIVSPYLDFTYNYGSISAYLGPIALKERKARFDKFGYIVA